MNVAEIEVGALLSRIGMGRRADRRHAVTRNLKGAAVLRLHRGENARQFPVVGLVIEVEARPDLFDRQLPLLHILAMAGQTFDQTKAALGEIALLDRPTKGSRICDGRNQDTCYFANAGGAT